MRGHNRDSIIENMKEIINGIPPKYYADILFDSKSSLSIIRTRSGKNIDAHIKNRGIVFRIFNGDRFYEISTASSDISKLKKQVSNLINKIEYNPKVDLIDYPKHKIDKEIPMKKDFTLVSTEQKIEKINEYYNKIIKIDEHVQNPIIAYSDSLHEKIFFNTEESLLYQKIPGLSIFLSPIVKIDGKIDSDQLIQSGQGGLEIMDNIQFDTLKKLVESSIELAQAPLPPSGSMPIILDPSVSGMLAHDVFGHGVQADAIYEGRSIWQKYYKKKIASEIVNITDKPIKGNIGNYFFDDEGVLAKKTPIIKNGVLSSYLHSRITASLLGMEEQLSGKGRRQNFMHPIFPRNSNTFIEPGNFEFDEMVKGIDAGILVSNADYGMEDFNGIIHCHSKSGYLIEKGELTTRVKGISISGNAIDLLTSVDAISKGPIEFIGMESRKGLNEIVPISYGGVYVRVQRSFVSPG